MSGRHCSMGSGPGPDLVCIYVLPSQSTGEAPYTLLYKRDPLLPVQKLINCTELYKGDSMLGKRIEQSWITLSAAAKMLEMMQPNKKRHYQHQRVYPQVSNR